MMESYTDLMKLFDAEAFNEFSRDVPSGTESDKAFLDVSISGLLDAEKLLDGVDLLKTEYDENAAPYFQVASLPVDSGNSSDDGSECRAGNSPQRSTDSGNTSADSQSKKRAAETSPEALEFDAADPTKAKRLQRNRESAALSRWRKKTAMQTLAVKSRELERTNSKLNYLLACSQSEVQALRAELMRYQSAGTVGQRALAPGESAELTQTRRTKYASTSGSPLPLESILESRQSSVRQHLSTRNFRLCSHMPSPCIPLTQQKLHQSRLPSLFLAFLLQFLAPKNASVTPNPFPKHCCSSTRVSSSGRSGQVQECVKWNTEVCHRKTSIRKRKGDR